MDGEIDFIDDQPETFAHRRGQHTVDPQRLAALDGPEADEIADRGLPVHVRTQDPMARTGRDLFDQTGFARAGVPDQHHAPVLDNIFDDVVKARREQIGRVQPWHQGATGAARHLEMADAGGFVTVFILPLLLFLSGCQSPRRGPLQLRHEVDPSG
jgi:hypothetical protein